MAQIDTLSIFQKGWNFSQDGPGNRLVYHLQGCNLRCSWCSNPEGMNASGTLMVNQAKLVPSVCPHGAITGTINRTICSRCMTKECVTVNRNEGIRLSAASCSINELIKEVTGAKSLFHSGGGVTLSGGEPTMQFDGVRTFLEALKAMEINTAIETNGTHPHLSELFPLIDTVIIDLKHYDDDVAAAVTGSPMTAVIANIAAAARTKTTVLVRITLIPGFNSRADDIRRFAGVLGCLPIQNIQFEVLAYHEYGKVKWEQCGMAYHERLPGEAIPLRQAETIFRDRGLNVITT